MESLWLIERTTNQRLKELTTMKIITVIGLSALLLCSTTYADQAIPMSDSLYQGKYFILSNKKQNGISNIVYKSIFKTGTVFSKMEINCSTKKYRKVGEGDSLKDIYIYPDKGNWIRPVEGASHDDVVKYICRKK